VLERGLFGYLRAIHLFNGLPPTARLWLKSNRNADIQKVNAIAAKATSGRVLISALITSAATAKRTQKKMLSLS
jgi:hypothetical protein